MSESGLHINQLRHAYADSDWQLRIDDFHLHSGEIVAVIGPNGSGKSTFLRLAAGVVPYKQGSIQIQGQELRRLERRQVARLLGYMPSDTTFEFDYRCNEVVSLGRYPHLSFGGFLQSRDYKVIEESMSRTETLEFQNRRLSHLSSGERQRVFLASVLAQEPGILLLDEPTSALDLHHQVRFFQIFSSLVQNGLSVLVVTHDINLASLFCHRIVLFHQGRILREGLPEDVLQADVIHQVYGNEILLSAHPRTGRPMVFPDLKGDSHD